MAKHGMEIECTVCGKRTLVRPDPIYEGFKKVGEAYICIECGHRYPSESETPFVKAEESRPRIFTEEDRPRALSLFGEEERQHSCCWCEHFVVNPFTQRCGLSNKFTDATDLCVRFKKRKEGSGR